MAHVSLFLAMWPALLSAAGLLGQLLSKMSATVRMRLGLPFVASTGHGAPPALEFTLAVVVLMLPIFASAIICALDAYRRHRVANEVAAAIALNAFSLLYFFFIFGSLAR